MNESYIASIQRVEDYVERHLAESMVLDELAKVGGFSPYHFHRIFRAFTGETVNGFVIRRRIERAAKLLRYDAEKSITEIAFDCGFAGSAPFARAFKKHFGVTASAWRKQALWRLETTAEPSGTAAESMSTEENEVLKVGTRAWRLKRGDLEGELRVETFTEKTVAYVRHVGPYKGDVGLFRELYGKLLRWAGPRGLLDGEAPERYVIYHNDLDVTDEDKLRMSVCITIPAGVEVSSGIGKTMIAAGSYAVARFRLTPEQHSDAWAMIYREWLPQCGYLPDERSALERFEYPDAKGEQPEEAAQNIVSICVPVKPE